MKRLCSLVIFCILSTSLFGGDTYQVSQKPSKKMEDSVEKNHQGPRGHRGLRGHKGHKGKAGPEGAPAYIGLSWDTNASVDISVHGAIVPLGSLNTGTSAHLLKYVDPDPTNALEDRYVQVLPGGGGTYLIQYSILAVNKCSSNPILLQVQINRGNGWDTSFPLDAFVPFRLLQEETARGADGTVKFLISLQDNDKVRIAAFSDNLDSSIGGLLPQSATRDVAFTLHRIDVD